MGICWGSVMGSPGLTNNGSCSPGPFTSSRTSSTATTTSSSDSKFSRSVSSSAGQYSVTSESSSADEDLYPVGKILEAPNLRVFSFAELRSSTKSFRPESMIGEGGFGKVYKGWVDERTLGPTKSGCGMVVAVKKLNPESMQGLEEWQSEVNFLGRLSHPNLVRLLGYCWDDKELLLVYEFMAKGSLENHLFKRGAFQPLSWNLRLRILVGAARGLAFLHGSERKVIYRDFKASNILLDSVLLLFLKHVRRLGAELQCQDFGFRPREARARRGGLARDNPGHGHLRLRGPGVRGHRSFVREERRVRVRGGAAGDAHRRARARHHPPQRAAQPGGVGAPPPGRPPAAAQADGPAPGAAVSVQGGRSGGAAGRPLPRRRAQEPALHEGGRRDAGADRGRDGRRRGEGAGGALPSAVGGAEARRRWCWARRESAGDVPAPSSKMTPSPEQVACLLCVNIM